MAALPARFFLQHARIEHLADQPHAGMTVQIAARGDGNPRRFLPAMLLGEYTLVDSLPKPPACPKCRKDRTFPSSPIPQTVQAIWTKQSPLA